MPDKENAQGSQQEQSLVERVVSLIESEKASPKGMESLLNRLSKLDKDQRS